MSACELTVLALRDITELVCCTYRLLMLLFTFLSVFFLAAGLSCLLFTAEVNTIPFEQTV